MSLPLLGEPCDQCGHPFDDHRLHLDFEDPPGGMVDCPVEGCLCSGMWGAEKLSPEAEEKARRHKEGQ